MDRSIGAHAATDDAETMRLRTLSESERMQLLDAACLAAEEIERSRLSAGLPPTQPAPWPESTWEFLKRHAANVRR